MKIAIFGSSGFSREVADICLDIGYTEIVFLDDNISHEIINEFPILAEENVGLLASSQFHFVIGIGDNKIRKKVYEKFPQIPYVNIIHPSATFGRNQFRKFSETVGNIVTAGVRFTNNIEVGNFGIYNLNSTIGHDVIIDDFVTISPGANISGNVHLEEGSYIGTNAAIIQGKSLNEKLRIGKYSTVGAGAVVTRNVPEDTVVKGIPAK